MHIKRFWLTAGLGLATAWVAGSAQAQSTSALSGQVSSAQESAMEGVLVSAKKEGTNITTTVVTDDKGQYSFPAGRLEPGKYSVSIRAVGYVLDGPKAVDVPDGKDAKADIKLNKTRNVTTQLTNAEWLNSAPGTHQRSCSSTAAAAATQCSESSPRRIMPTNGSKSSSG